MGSNPWLETSTDFAIPISFIRNGALAAQIELIQIKQAPQPHAALFILRLKAGFKSGDITYTAKGKVHKAGEEYGLHVPPEGFEPSSHGPKPRVLSIELQGRFHYYTVFQV